MNKYLKFIKQNVTAFSIEIIIYDVSGAIPFLFIESFRRLPGENKKYLTMFIIMFLLFAFF